MSIQDDTLHIELTVPERVVSLHGGTLNIPVNKIVRALAVPDVLAHVRGARTPDSGQPGRLAIGVWHGDQAGRTFSDFVLAHRSAPGVVLTLKRAEFDRILVETPRAEQLVADLGGTTTGGGPRPSG